MIEVYYHLIYCLLCAKTTNPENTAQFKLVEVWKSKRVNDLLIHNTITITLYNSLITFRDTGNEFELKGELSKKITKKHYNVDLASLSEEKLGYYFAKGGGVF